MSVERERKALELLDEVLEQPAGDRVVVLDQHCDDPEVRRRVEELLRDETDSDGLALPAFDVHRDDPAVGRRVGDYRLVELLGRGGMGAVYLAEREDFDQRVALKLIRRGLDADPQLIRRFHNERQILARLDHRYIARLLDGGTTDDHLPYFVMEQVEGEPIHRYCRNQGLGIVERLELFRKVCEAVQSAHRSLVVHRDLKPGNVLITADGEPKLLDFGIAKLLDDELAARPVATIPGQGPMTPRYASPEQIRLEPITTASDVYSLGVLLFELLTGQSPYDTPDDSAATVGKAVCEQEPLAPSTAVRRRGDASDDPALPPVDTLRKQLSGDLDSIVLKALQKRPEDRYGSVEALSADLERHLAGHPVSAREGTWMYRLGKGIRRHRLAASIATGFFLLGIGSGVVSTILLRQAQVASQLSADIAEFLQELLIVQDPDYERGDREKAIDLLRRGEELLNLLNTTQAKLDLAATLGSNYGGQGAYEDAVRLSELALEISEQLYEGDHPETAKHLANLGFALVHFGDLGRAEGMFEASYEMRLRLGETGAELYKVRSNQASVMSRLAHYSEAAEILAEILSGRLQLHGEDDLRVATTRRNLAANLYGQGDLAKAEEQLRESLRVRQSLQGTDHTSVASVLDLLGNVLASQQRTEAAEKVLLRALSIRESKLRPGHRDLAISRKSLAVVLIATNSEEAGRLLELARNSLLEGDPEGWRLAEVESALGALRTHLGRFEEAEALLLEARAKLIELRTENALPTRINEERLSDLYRKSGLPDRRPSASPTDDPPAPETNP